MSDEDFKVSSSRRAELLAKRLRTASQSASSPIPKLAPDSPAPLSYSQFRLWFLQQIAPDDPVYNRPLLLELDGNLDYAALEKSLHCIIQRHNVLRSIFPVVKDEPVQLIQSDASQILVCEDFRTYDDAWNEMQEMVLQPFDLIKGPVFRWKLYRLSPTKYFLLAIFHHIVFDAWSAQILTSELAANYMAIVSGEQTSLPDLTLTYADYSAWQHEKVKAPVFQAQREFWKKTLSNAPTSLDLPTYQPRALQRSTKGARLSETLPVDIVKLLNNFARSEDVTPFMVLLTSFRILLQRHSGQADLIIGAAQAGRELPGTERLIGPFINNLALRASFDLSDSFRKLVKKERQICLEAYSNQELPFEIVLEDLGLQRDTSRTPLFQAYLNQHFSERSIDLPELRLTPRTAPLQGANFDLILYTTEVEAGMRLDLVYNTELYQTDWAEQLLKQYVHLLVDALADPDRKGSEISFVTESAKHILPDPSGPIYPIEFTSLPDLISTHANRDPAKVAIIDPGSNCTYAELDEWADKTAGAIIQAGVKPGEVVAIYADRCVQFLQTVIGVLKAGAVLLILDPAYPSKRLGEYVKIARPSAWVNIPINRTIPQELHEELDQVGAKPIQLVFDSKDKPSSVPIHLKAHDPAYIIFTSGSTGQPKGIIGAHHSLTHFLPWVQDTFGVGKDDRFSTLFGLAHDALLREIFMPLGVGGTLCIPDSSEIAPRHLAHWAQRMEITISHLTPAMAQVLLAGSENIELGKIKRLFTVGDVLTYSDADRLLKLANSAELVNLYGSTEAARAVTYFCVPRDRLNGNGQVPLGRAVPAAQALILNPAGLLAGIGELGEIYIRSPHLSNGYLRDEEKTASKFVQNPFSEMAEDRMYRTGDLGRYLPDGNIQFAGRADRQIKIRGFRIEPGEIEAALEQHPAVEDVIVLPRDDPNAEKHLVAYVVPKGNLAISHTDLRRFLKDKLPEYMIPTQLVALTTMPMTPNRKIASAELPNPDWTSTESSTLIFDPDSIEEKVAQEWDFVLNHRPILLEEDFFQAGGHSLLALKLLQRIEDSLDIRLPLAAFFQNPTFANLVTTIREEELKTSSYRLVPLKSGDITRPIICLHDVSGQVNLYLPMIQTLHDGISVYGVQPGSQESPSQPKSVEQMAELAIKAIQKVQPMGPYHLVGYSFGGILAFEVARQLREQGYSLGKLFILDSQLGSITNIIPALSTSRRFSWQVNKAAAIFRHHKSQLIKLEWKDKIDYVKQRLVKRRWAATTPKLDSIETYVPGWIESAWRINRQAVQSYIPHRYSGEITLIRASEQHLATVDPVTLGWKEVADRVQVHTLPGDHMTVMASENARSIASIIERNLRAGCDIQTTLVNYEVYDFAAKPAEPYLWPDADSVHLWWINLSTAEDQIEIDSSILTRAEREWSEQMIPEARARWQMSRAVLRQILAGYCGVDPTNLELDKLPGGKPFLVQPFNTLKFNLSHSGSAALVAVCLNDVGVDLEHLERSVDWEILARRFFNPGEVERIMQFAAEDRKCAFFTTWTLKEAFIKATGDGLSFPLDQFEVKFSSGPVAQLLNISGEPIEPGQWSLFNLSLMPGYQGSVAVNGAVKKIKQYRWDKL